MIQVNIINKMRTILFCDISRKQVSNGFNNLWKWTINPYNLQKSTVCPVYEYNDWTTNELKSHIKENHKIILKGNKKKEWIRNKGSGKWNWADHIASNVNNSVIWKVTRWKSWGKIICKRLCTDNKRSTDLKSFQLAEIRGK